MRSVRIEFGRRGPSFGPVTAAAVCALIGTLFYVGDRIPYSTDSAIVALEAQDILYTGARPVFYAGSQYAGALQQYLVAAAFAVLPDGREAQFAVSLAMLLVELGLVWYVTRRVFDDRAATAAAWCFALGPSYLYYRGLLADGPYQTIFLLFAVLLALVVEIEHRGQQGVPSAGWLIALGGVYGLAWWTHPLAIPAGVALIGVAVNGRWWRRFPHPASWLAALTAFFVASAPWWLHNLGHDFETLRGSDAVPATLAGSVHQAFVLLYDSLGLFVGLPGLPGVRGWLRVLAVVAWLATLLVFFARRTRRRATAPQRAFAVYVGLLVALALVLALTSQRGTMTDPRFIYPAFLFLIPTAGALFTSAAPRPVLLALALGVLFCHGVGYRTAGPYPDRRPESRRIEATGVTGVYTDFFYSSVLTLDTARSVIGTPFGRGALVRREGDRKHVDALPRPGFFLTRSESLRLQRFLDGFADSEGSSGSKNAADSELSATVVKITPTHYLTFDVPAPALAVLRGCYCLPSGLSSKGVTWRGADGPKQLTPGGHGRFRVGIANRDSLAWVPGMSVAYRWHPAGRDVISEAQRVPGTRLLAAGQSATLDIEVVAPETPGDYVIEFDFVEEGVAWFSKRGSPGPRLEVSVRP